MTTAETRITFFHLPREVRDTIYDFALGFRQLELRYGCLSFLISPPVPEIVWPSLDGLPLWLLTSRAVRDESINVLLRTRRISPSSSTHRCKRPPRRTGRCFPEWHPPILTWRQRMRMREKPQQRLGRTLQQRTRNSSTTLKEATPHISARPPPTLSCNPVSQSLLLHPGSVRHMLLNFPTKLDVQRALYYAYDLTYRNNIHPWIEFLAMVHPFIHPSNLCLTLTWDAEYKEYLEPYFDWPVEWLGQFEHVEVILLAREAQSAELKQRIESVVYKLVKGSKEDVKLVIWAMEPVYEKPTLPPCDLHGEACPHIELQRPRRGEISRYTMHVKAPI